jgi:CheY-like chemotaxis protein
MVDGSCDVLLIEQDAESRDAAAVALEGAGLSVVAASSGVAALRVLHEGLTPSVILLDVTMKGAAGGDLLGELRAYPVLAYIPVIAMVAAAVLQPVPAAAVLVKPVDPDHLLRAVWPLARGATFPH